MDIVYTHEMSTTRRGTRYSGPPHAPVVHAPVVQEEEPVDQPVDQPVDAPVERSRRGHGTRSLWVVGLSATILAILAFLLIPRHAKESFTAKEPPKVEAVNTVGKLLLQLGAPHLFYSKELHPSHNINDLKTVYETAFGGTDQEFECYMKTADEKLLFFVTLTRYREQKVFQYEVQFNHQQQFQGLVPYVAATTPKHSPAPGKTSSIVAAFPSLSKWVTPRHADREFDPDALCGVRIGSDKKITLYGSNQETVKKVKEILLKLKGSEEHGKPDETVVEKVAMGFLYVHFRPFFEKVKVAAKHYGVPVATMLAIVVALAFGRHRQRGEVDVDDVADRAAKIMQESQEAQETIDGVRQERLAAEERLKQQRSATAIQAMVRGHSSRRQQQRARLLQVDARNALRRVIRHRRLRLPQPLALDLQHPRQSSILWSCIEALLSEQPVDVNDDNRYVDWWTLGGKKTKKRKSTTRSTRKKAKK